MTKCAYPGCDYEESSHRPYARARDGIPSASTIAGSLDDGKARSFGWAASLIAAVTAVHETERWWQLPTAGCTHEKDGLCQACRFIRSEFDRVWSAKAARGGHIHHLALSWANGESVDTNAEIEPYLDALWAFYKDTQPEFVELERTVLYKEADRSYRGQFDFIARLDRGGQRRLGLWDIKTGSYYPVEQTLQLAGYRHAHWLTTWEGKVEVLDKEMPVVDEAGVLLLGADGEYRLIELPADKAAHEMFLQLRRLWGWAKEIERWEKDRAKGEAAA